MDDNERICALLAKERQCRVSHRPQELEECFYEDATAITSWTGGRVPIQQYLHGGNAPVNDPECPIVSRISYPVIHRNGNKAYAEVPQTTMRWVVTKGEHAILTCYMRLIYKVEKRENEWKILDFSSIYESDELNPAVPGTDLQIDLEELMKYRHPIRYMSYVDGDVCPTLPGIDQPDVINGIYAELDAWLQA